MTTYDSTTIEEWANQYRGAAESVIFQEGVILGAGEAEIAAKVRMRSIENTLILGGEVAGRNERERAANLEAALEANQDWVAAREGVDNARREKATATTMRDAARDRMRLILALLRAREVE